MSTAAAAVPLVSRTAFAQQAVDQNAPVVVVGAGLAGLHVASLLRKAGRDVMVFEARAEPGGRVRTVRDAFTDGAFGEAGAIRISGAHQRVLALAKEYRLNVIPFSSSNGADLVTIGRTPVRADRLTRTPLPLELKPSERGLSQGLLLERYIGTLPADLATPTPTAAMYEKWAEYDRLTWPDWLRSRGASEGAVKLMTLGGDSRELSALYVLRQYALSRGRTQNQFYKIEGGMDRLPHAIADALGPVVRYNTTVQAVDQTGPAIVIDYKEHDETKRAAASYLVVTVPFPLVADIEFYPDLSPEKRRLTTELPYFPATRFLLQAYTRFWQAAGLSGYVRSDQPIEVWDSTYELPARSGILGVTVGGALGRRLLTMSEEAAVPYGRELVALSLPQIQSSYQTGVAQQWARDPWAKGAFAVFRPGQMSTMMPLAAQPEGRVHFAGEHTSSWMGWMEGALESGERAAREVLG